MKRCLTFALFAWIALSARLPAQTVVAWNLEWYPGRNPDQQDPTVGEQQIKTAKDELRKLNPDVFIAEEMRDREVFDDLISVVPGLRTAVVTSFPEADGTLARQQIGIATKLPIHAAWSEKWRDVMAIPRGFAFAALRDPASGKLLLVYGVHLKSNRAEDEKATKMNFAMRTESADQLVENFSVLSRLMFPPDQVRGWLIGGDFNTNDDGEFGDRVIRTLKEAHFHNTWEGVEPDKRQTWRGDVAFQPTTFDFIMTRGLGDHRVELADPPPETSDHRPVILRLGSAE